MEQALHGTTQSRNLFYLEKGLLGGGGWVELFFSFSFKQEGYGTAA